MSKIRILIRHRTECSQTRLNFRLFQLGALLGLALVLSLCPARAEDPDDEYVRIFGLIQQADTLQTDGKSAAALAKYQQAQTALQSFKKTNPKWNVNTIGYRLNYVTEKISALSEKPAAPADAPAAGAPESKPADAKPAAMPASVQVKLLEAGAEPRQVLRLHPKTGDKQRLDSTIKMDVQMQMGGMDVPATKMPAMRMTMDFTVKDVSAGGDISYEMVMNEVDVATDEPGVMPQMAEMLKAGISKLKGMSGNGILSDRGIMKSGDLKVPAGADPQTRQTMEQMKDTISQVTFPLPEEAVGAGARWEVKRTTKSQGMQIQETATYQLVSLEGENLALKGTVTQRAENQKIENPAMPGVKVEVKKMSGQGEVKVAADLAHLVPTKRTGDLRSEMNMGIDMGGQSQAMTMKLGMNFTMEAK